MPALSSASTPLPAFTAVLLAGGMSSRMGQDKAGLLIDGETLWKRQLQTLRESGAGEIFISGRADGPYAGAGVPIIGDVEPGLGPLGGIVAAMEKASHPLMLILAIDLPRMTTEYLRSLVCEGAVVPCRGQRFEPLAAVYPTNRLEWLRDRLAARELSLQRAVGELVHLGAMAVREVNQSEAALFDNLNTPEDLAYFVGPSSS